MSSGYGVYFRCDPNSALKFSESTLRIKLHAAEDAMEGVLQGEVVGIPVTFDANHGLVDDAGIPFTEYPVSLSFTRHASQGEPELLEDLCRLLALLCSRTALREGLGKTMVVYDVQSLVEVNGE